MLLIVLIALTLFVGLGFVNYVKATNEVSISEKVEEIKHKKSYVTYDEISEELLRSYGVKCTFTIEGGKAQVTPGSERSLYGLNRFYVKPTTTDEEFLQWVG